VSAAALAVGAVVGLALGIPHLAKGGSGRNARIVLRAPDPTTPADLTRAREIILRRLVDPAIHDAQATIAGKDLIVTFSGPSSFTGTDELANSLASPGLFEERAVIGSPRPYVSGTTHLTSCPRPAPTRAYPATGCDNLDFVKCPLDEPTVPGCGDHALASESVTYVGQSLANPSILEVYALGPARIGNSAISSARAVFQPAGSGNLSSARGWQVDFTFTPSGSRRFASVTGRLVGNALAFVFDRNVESAPVVMSAITNGSGVLTGIFTERKAKGIAASLSAGPLPVPLQIQAAGSVAERHGGSVGVPLVIGLACVAGLLAVGLMVRRHARMG